MSDEGMEGGSMEQETQGAPAMEDESMGDEMKQVPGGMKDEMEP